MIAASVIARRTPFCFLVIILLRITTIRGLSVPNKNMASRRMVLILSGPTAVGKSAIAAQICQQIGGLIVSADSVQAYREVQIGANKPTREERLETPHLLVDVVDGDIPYNAAEWTRDAHFCIQQLLQNESLPRNEKKDGVDSEENVEQKRRKEIEQSIHDARQLKNLTGPVTPVVVGGTMMYLKWLVHGRPDAIPPTSEAIAQAVSILEPYIATGDWSGAVEHVQSKYGEPFATQAAKLSFNDWYRLRRVLEVAFTEGDDAGRSTFSGERQGGLLDLYEDVRCFFLCPNDRYAHAHLIDDRCEQMIQKGLLSETADLNLPDMVRKAIGYRQTLDFLCSDEPSFDNYLTEFQGATRRYAKRQMQWFRKDPEFFFVPVQLDDKDRIEKATEQVMKLIRMSRSEYDQMLAAKEKLNHQTRTMNEEQAKTMKTFQTKITRLIPGSNERLRVMEEASACIARFQKSNRKGTEPLSYKRPNAEISE
ncbi:tRNA dimethylallyltransferase [Fistulifera solaris]|uniref:tRNA dimethylallyltransferase n=1 Tax=Fistulifera solaris TaxID=1519565 RepID=A0A1Z5KHR8_FISSO|nr:tRNA dimethylallyltransferase [Fistulifera solaris]|eukprot:GAX25767.1 tRNA dimethylallyltransferase [Fistulifera solaris]